MDLRRSLFFFYRSDDRLKEKIEILSRAAEKNRFTLTDDPKKANIIAAIGTDGTFLQAVRKTGFRQDCLYTGINTDCAPSFYCDFHIDEIGKMEEAMNRDRVEVRRYPTIEVTINDEGKTFYCLNEVTIRSSIVKTFVMNVYIDDFHFETFRGDGMIISTPTGSTGYTKSVHGAVIDPLIPCFQVSELASLNNNHYRTLDSPFLLGKQRTLTLEVVESGNEFPIISMDNEALSLKKVNTIRIRLSDRIIKTVKMKDNSFWHKVRRTFL
jgi:ATP-NAD kinase.